MRWSLIVPLLAALFVSKPALSQNDSPAPVTATVTPLPAGIEKILQRHKIPRAGVSLVVQAVDEEQPRLALNAQVPRNPASTIKLVTTWAALDILGPTHTWRTRIYALGPIVNGIVNGDLLIKGQGDPFLVLEDMWKMLGELRRAGVREISGDLLIDNSAFNVIESDPAAFDGQGSRLYNTLPSALMVNFQALNFRLIAEPSGGTIKLTVDPDLPNLTLTNQVRATNGKCGGKRLSIAMNTAADTPDHVVFSGEMPLACREYRLGRSAMTPQSYAYGAFRMLWEQWGGSLAGEWREASLSGKHRPLVDWHSRPLAEVIRPLNKWSNNLMTRMLLYTLASTAHSAPVTRAQGAEVVIDHLRSRGLDVDTLVIDNGAGLSRDTRITTRLMSDLLRLAWHQPTMPEFVASLAISGKDGTVRKRFRKRKEAGSMHLKTGSIDSVSAISGYVHTPAGRTFVVSMMANGRRVNYGAGKELQDAVLAWAFRQQ